MKSYYKTLRIKKKLNKYKNIFSLLKKGNAIDILSISHFMNYFILGLYVKNRYILAFIIGLISDLLGVSSYLGLAPLTLSITAYLSGFLYGKYERLLPYFFHSYWLATLFLHFFILNYFLFQSLFISDKIDFFIIWFLSSSYTLIFIFILQFFYPLKEASRAKII